MPGQPNTALKIVIESFRKNDYPALKVDDYFEIFSAQQVLKSAHFTPDHNQIEAGILGGGNDGGVDGFYLYANRKLILEDTDLSIFKGQRVEIELVIVQAKNTGSFEESVPMKFKDFVENALAKETPTEATKKLYSEELLDSVTRFRNLYTQSLVMHPTLSVYFYHASHADHVDAKVTERGNILCEALKQHFPIAKCSFIPMTGTELIKLAHKSEPKTLPLKTANPLPFVSFNTDAYVCVVQLQDFFAFISDERPIPEREMREAIFEANVRDYAPDAKVNQGIEQTLKNPPAEDDFWWLNNGVTVLASKAYHHSGNLQITDPLIVNGLQTSYQVFRHFKDGGNLVDKRSIMVKVIVTTNDATSDRIINATNSQTKINSIFLHSTEQIHRNIEITLKEAGFYYDRRKNYYRNLGKPVSEIITIPYLAQAVASIVLQQPNDARVRPGTVAEKSYNQLFSTAYPPELYTKCIKLMKRCYKFLQDKSLGRTDVLNIVFYLAMYVTCAACQSVKPKRPTIAALNIEEIKDKVFEDCYKWIDTEFQKLGGDDRVAKGPNLTENLKKKIIAEFGGKTTKKKSNKGVPKK